MGLSLLKRYLIVKTTKESVCIHAEVNCHSGVCHHAVYYPQLVTGLAARDVFILPRNGLILGPTTQYTLVASLHPRRSLRITRALSNYKFMTRVGREDNFSVYKKYQIIFYVYVHTYICTYFWSISPRTKLYKILDSKNQYLKKIEYYWNFFLNVKIFLAP